MGKYIQNDELQLKQVSESNSLKRQLMIDANGNVFYQEKTGGFFANTANADGSFASLSALTTATPADETLIVGKYADVVETVDSVTTKTRYSRIAGEWVKVVNQEQLDDINQANADALNRANHTGEQAISTVTNLSTELGKAIQKTVDIETVEYMTQTEWDAIATKPAKQLTFIPKA